MKIVVLDGSSVNPGDLSYKFLDNYGDVSIYDYTDESQIYDRISDTDIVLTNKVSISREVIEKANNLKFICLLSTGYNIIDIEAANENNIVVSNIPDYSSMAVAQFTFSLILQFYSKISIYDKIVKSGEWGTSGKFCIYNGDTYELFNKTIGIIGFGSIAQKVSEIAKSFGMNILVYSRTVKKEYESNILSFVDKEYLFKNSDIISIHCPLNKNTYNMVNKDLIKFMKYNSIIINTSRGSIINEVDLSTALNKGKIMGAGMDVVSVEPIEDTNPLLTAKNCIITPHMAWSPIESRSRMLKICEENIICFIKGNPINRIK